MSDDEPNRPTIDIDASLDAEGQLTIGDRNVQVRAESQATQALHALAATPETLRLLALRLLPPSEVERAASEPDG